MSRPDTMQLHISVTGFRLRHRFLAPLFWFHAIRALAQARAAPGNRFASARTVGGVHHTLTAWTDRAAMRAYLGSVAHRSAMRAFPLLGTGRTCGFDAAMVPDWATALETWHATAREVPRPRSGTRDLPK